MEIQAITAELDKTLPEYLSLIKVLKKIERTGFQTYNMKPKTKKEYEVTLNKLSDLRKTRHKLQRDRRMIRVKGKGGDFETISKKFNLPTNKLTRDSDGSVDWTCSHGKTHMIYSPIGRGLAHNCDGCCVQVREI